MGKVIVLLLVILLALASVAGYLFLTEKITAGEMKVADGKMRLEKGQLELEAGKVKLEAGKLELSEGKKEYEDAEDNIFLLLADKWLNSGKGFEAGREKIAEGDRQVAIGEDKVSAGEKQLDAGAMKLSRGLEQLKLARKLLVACEIGAVLFGFLSIVLGFLWRQSLTQSFKRAVS